MAGKLAKEQGWAINIGEWDVTSGTSIKWSQYMNLLA